MTEDEWMACTDPHKMLEFLRGKVSDRKLRLFALAGCSLCHGSAFIPILEVVERFIDGLCTATDVREHWGHSEEEGQLSWPERPSEWALSFAASVVLRDDGFPTQEDLIPIVRDLFGNPFRPPAIAPAVLGWNDGLVRRLAAEAYEHRLVPLGHLDPQWLAVLADALEEAGAGAELVEHLRGPVPHWRGCWPVDLVLQKR